jgi:hypothetical protein
MQRRNIGSFFPVQSFALRKFAEPMEYTFWQSLRKIPSTNLSDMATSQALEALLVPSSSWSSESSALAGRKKWLNTKTAAEG